MKKLRSHLFPFLAALLFMEFIRGPLPETIASEGTTPKSAFEIARRYRVNGDGTMTDKETGLMWAVKDSYADLGKCLDWNGAMEYVKKLRTGKYKDWRMPTIEELKGLYHEPLSNTSVGGHMIHIDSKFAPESALVMWSSSKIHSCCPSIIYFTNGSVANLTQEYCGQSGVRPVRSLP